MKHIKLFEEFINESNVSINESKEIAKMIDISNFTPSTPDFKELIKINKGMFYNSGMDAIVALALDEYKNSDLFNKVSQELETEINKLNNNSTNNWINSMKSGSGYKILDKNILDTFVKILYKYEPDNDFLKEYAINILGNKDISKQYQNNLTSALNNIKVKVGNKIILDNPNYQGVTAASASQKNSRIEIPTKTLIQKLQDKINKLYKINSTNAINFVNNLNNLSYNEIINLLDGIYNNEDIK
jgi:hypothetical protein